MVFLDKCFVSYFNFDICIFYKFFLKFIVIIFDDGFYSLICNDEKV